VKSHDSNAIFPSPLAFLLRKHSTIIEQPISSSLRIGRKAVRIWASDSNSNRSKLLLADGIKMKSHLSNSRITKSTCRYLLVITALESNIISATLRGTHYLHLQGQRINETNNMQAIYYRSIRAAARSRAWTDFARSIAGIVGSNPTVWVYSVFL
jgi:hypothetical protein